MKIVITLDIDEFYKDEILNNIVRLDFVCADKTVIERDKFTLKPMPEYRDEHYKSFSIELSNIINSENRGYNDCLREILGEEE